MVQTYREAIQCERLREEVFQGKRAPLLFGEPEAWVALLIEAMLREGQGELAAAKTLRDQAFEQAPATSGTLDGAPFEWLADADMRIGPVLSERLAIVFEKIEVQYYAQDDKGARKGGSMFTTQVN